MSKITSNETAVFTTAKRSSIRLARYDRTMVTDPELGSASTVGRVNVAYVPEARLGAVQGLHSGHEASPW